jgi:hypothetical protein
MSGELTFMISAGAVPLGMAALIADRPASAANPFRTPQRRKDLAFRLTFGLTVGLAGGLTVGLAGGLVLGLAGGLAYGFVSRLGRGVTGGLAQEPGPNLGARAVIRSDALVGLTFGLLWGLTYGLAGVIGNGLTVGLVGGLTVGLAFGFLSGGRAAWRYAVFLLCSRRRLPFRLGLFLDWAVTAGLMRYSGPAYQYRHRELQHWLRQHPHPRLDDPAPAEA